MARKLLFSLITVFALMIFSERGIFGASGDIWIAPPSVPGTITLSGTVVTPPVDRETPAQKRGKTTFPKIQKKRFELPGVSDDASIYRFVSRSVSLTDTGYEPKPLASISGAHIGEA